MSIWSYSKALVPYPLFTLVHLPALSYVYEYLFSSFVIYFVGLLNSPSWKLYSNTFSLPSGSISFIILPYWSYSYNTTSSLSSSIFPTLFITFPLLSYSYLYSFTNVSHSFIKLSFSSYNKVCFFKVLIIKSICYH